MVTEHLVVALCKSRPAVFKVKAKPCSAQYCLYTAGSCCVSDPLQAMCAMYTVTLSGGYFTLVRPESATLLISDAYWKFAAVLCSLVGGDL